MADVENTGPSPSDDSTVTEPVILPKFEDSLLYKISDKISTGLVDGLISNGKVLTEIEMTGAVKQVLYGISTDNRLTWSDLLSELIGVSTSNSLWAGKMFSMDPFSFGSMDGKAVLTNTVNASPASSSLPYPDGLVLDTQIFSYDHVQMGLLVSSASRKNLVTGSESHTCYRFNHLDLLSDLVERCGYRVNETYKPFITAGSIYNEPLETIKSIQKYFTTGSGVNSGTDAFLKFSKKVGFPGTKWLSIFWTTSGQDAMYHTVGKWGFLNTTLNQGPYTACYQICIPIVDDSTNKSPALWYDHSKKTFTTFNLDDSRYATHANGLCFNANEYKRHTGNTSFVLPDGSSKALNTIPAFYWTGTWSPFSNFLPFLICPLDDAFYIFNSMTVSDKKYDYKGKEVTVKKIQVSVQEFYAKITKDWYEQYYTTGFGLFQPKNSNIQANVLKKWKEYDFDSIGICMTGAAKGFSASNTIEALPLYKEYAKAREKACKTNDWYSKEWASGVTWGAVRNNMNNNPNRKVFFCANGVSVGNLDFDFRGLEMAGVSWTVTSKKGGNGLALKDSFGYDVWVLTRSAGTDVQTFEEGEESLLRCLEEVCQGASGPDKTILGRKAGLYDNEIGSIDDIKSGLGSSDLVRTGNTLRFKMRNDFFFNQSMLANSGYPAYSYMRSPNREMMVVRCYGDLDKMCSPMVKIIESFTDQVVINKILNQK